MPERIPTGREFPNSRRPPQPPVTPPAPPPDLFGFVPPASPTRASTARPAEWPAAGARPARVAPVYAAPDRELASAPRPPADLAGTYARRGVCLERADRVALFIRGTYRRSIGPTDAPRFVELGYPGGGRPAFVSGLYDRGGDPDDALDGHAFQHGKRGPWYRIVRTGPDLYRVERTQSRRRGRVST